MAQNWPVMGDYRSQPLEGGVVGGDHYLLVLSGWGRGGGGGGVSRGGCGWGHMG